MMGVIDWNLFENKFFRLEDGDWVRVELADWHSEAQYCFGDKEDKRPALVFRVVSINEAPVTIDKHWVTTSRIVAEKMRPIIDLAEAKGQRSIKVVLSKIKGRYAVTPLQ